MKIRYPVIPAIAMFIAITSFDTVIPYEIRSMLGQLIIVCLGLIAYLIIRNIFHALKKERS